MNFVGVYVIWVLVQFDFIGFLKLFLESLVSGNLKDKRGEKKMTWALFECWFDFI